MTQMERNANFVTKLICYRVSLITACSLSGDSDRSQSGSSFDVSKISPGAYGAQSENIAPGPIAFAERMSLDMGQLRQQYYRLRERQKQAHIILAGEFNVI